MGGGDGYFAHKCFYWFDFEILIPFALSNLTNCCQIAHRKKKTTIKFSFNIGNILVALYMFSRAFDCVSQRTFYLIEKFLKQVAR